MQNQQKRPFYQMRINQQIIILQLRINSIITDYIVVNMNCQCHGWLISFLCCEPCCKDKRMCCELCKQKQHKNHNCKAFGQINDLIRQINFNPGSISQAGIINQAGSAVKSIETSINAVYRLFNEFDETYQSIAEMMRNSKVALQQKICPVFYKIKMMLNGIFNKRLIQFSKQPQKFNKQIEQSCQIIRFLTNPGIKNQPRIIEGVNKKMKSCLSELKKKMEEALYQFNIQMSKCSLSNWHKIYEQQNNLGNNKIKQKQQIQNNIEKQIQIIKQGEQIKSNEDGQVYNYIYTNIEKTLQQIFRFRSPDMIIARKFNSIFYENSIKPIQIEKNPIRIQMRKNQIINKQRNQFTRFVMRNIQISEALNKSVILGKLDQLATNPSYAQNLKEFILQGPNQFDAECLMKLAYLFPNLEKFNYIWNFQEDGLRLQKQQVFFEVTRTLDKNPKDLEMCQQLLDIYGRFQHLQNLTISQIQNFAYKQMKIKNKQLKHLTLGEYVQSWQQKIIPNNLKRETLYFESLITLNLFNIQVVDGDFFEKIVKRNNNSLKNIWMSECIELEESVLKAIGDSRIQTLIFEQIKKLNHSIQVPTSIITLIVENCDFRARNSFIGLQSAANIKNFSIFQSNFHEQSGQIGDQLIKLISKINPCNVEYLNVGECKTVTNESLNNMKLMTKLKQLCIDNTKILLYNFSRAQECLKNIQRLGIVGLLLQEPGSLKMEDEKQTKDVSYKNRIEKILKRAPKLKILSLKFQDDLASINKDLLGNLYHISLSATRYKRQYKNKNLRQFVNVLKSMKKSINIV